MQTTERTIEYLLMDLLENPEYIQDLREEIITVLKENGKLDKTALFNLKKMDSVMRESMRIHSGGFSESTLSTPLVSISFTNAQDT